MRVLFDHQIFSYQRFGGASRYYHELMSVLSATGVDVQLGVAWSPNEYLAHAAYYRGRVTKPGGRIVVAQRWPCSSAASVMIQSFCPFDVL